MINSTLTGGKKSNVHAFIISWQGQHESAQLIAQQLFNKVDQLTVVYSDPNEFLEINFGCEKIKRPNHLFWADKFKTCIENFNSDLILFIHADCKHSNWSLIAQEFQVAMTRYPIIGLWSALIDNTYFSLEKTRIGAIDPSLIIVAQTDAVVFGFRKETVTRMKLANYSFDIYGWGLQWLVAAHVYTNKKIAIVDKSLKIQHAQGSGYPIDVAAKQMQDFFVQFNTNEILQYKFLTSYIEMKKQKTKR